MKYDEVTATVDVLAMKHVRSALQAANVPGISMFQIKGYGKRKNFFRRGWMQQYTCIRVIVPQEKTNQVVQAIMDAAHGDMEGDGIIAVNPLTGFYNIRNKKRLDG